MKNKIRAILLAAAVGTMVLAQGQIVSAAEFEDGAELFSDGTDVSDPIDGSSVTDTDGSSNGSDSDATGSVSALASALAKQTEEQTQAYMEKEEEAAQVREERRVEKAQKAAEKAEKEKEEALQTIQQTVEDAKKKAEEAKKKAEEEARKKAEEEEKKAAEEARKKAEEEAKKAEEEAKKAEEQRLAKRQAVVDFALQFEGNPYVYGGTSLTNGADCSGFVMSVFANFGYSLPRVAADQCAASTRKDISQLEPGDLVFYGNGYIDHVALYIGDGKIIHASGAATGIKISNYDYQQPAAIGTYME